MSQKFSASPKNPMADHPAWRGPQLSIQKTTLLQNQKPYSYLLGLSEHSEQFAVSWVGEDGLIFDAYFGYNPETKTWFYSNGSPHECKHFEDLLSGIFHCTKEDLIPCN